MIVQGDEFDETFTISSITFASVPGMGDATTFFQLYVDLGYCADSELCDVYENNYVSGTKTRVFERNSNYTITANSPTITFDTPFVFDPAQGNLIIDIIWPDGEGEIYTYNFPTLGVSAISGAYDLPSGYSFTDMSHLVLEGELSLCESTFASIKRMFIK